MLGLGVADELRPDEGPAIAGDEADGDMRIADLRLVGGDDDVAEQGEGGAEPRRMAVEAADQRLVEVELAEDDVLGLAARRLELGGVVDGGLHPVDVAAGAEGAALAGQDDDVGLRIVAGIEEDPRQLLVKLGVDGVQLVRPVQ